uniref:Putative secreted protein n=1 Tax=Ixodes ricinus TaxID=34613 RepID=A0A6B0UXC9_IXORI
MGSSRSAFLNSLDIRPPCFVGVLLVPVGEAAPDLAAFSSVGGSDLAAPPACWGAATGDAAAAAVTTVAGAWTLVAAFGAPCFLASWAPRELGTDTLRGGGADRGPLGFVSDAKLTVVALEGIPLATICGDATSANLDADESWSAISLRRLFKASANRS